MSGELLKALLPNFSRLNLNLNNATSGTFMISPHSCNNSGKFEANLLTNNDMEFSVLSTYEMSILACRSCSVKILDINMRTGQIYF